MNKFYIQIVLFLLSISVYVNNKSLAAEPNPGNDTSLRSIPDKDTNSSEEVSEESKELLYNDHNETEKAAELMKEAVTQFIYHATTNDGYELCKEYKSYSMVLYKKKHQDDTNVQKLEYKLCNSDRYHKIISKLWDSDRVNSFDIGFIHKKVVRTYNPNLVMIQQRYKTKPRSRQKYFYALATKVEISEGTTIIAMVSVDIIDKNASDKEYKNTIVESANLFKTDITPEDDIKKGKLDKAFLNIGGYLIEKKDKCINMTYLESMDEEDSIYHVYKNELSSII
ncbi:fam-a protein [Plasmodium vinckei]|uniref:Fam-a protein n=1 Tax=Plasmodium vinckei TaxID=5860 RepID=A0A6V7SH02_PLAVN|nr:fam-a protein [Plasmodium vinckei]